MRSLTLPLLAFLVSSTSPLRAGETVANEQLGLRLTLPDGYVSKPDLAQGKMVYVFQHAPVEDQKGGKCIFVTRLGGVIGRERLDPKKVAEQGPQVTVSTEKWKTFDIEVFRVPETAEGIQVLTFNAQVPLKPNAVQVSVAGEAADEEELRADLRAVLANLEGQSNWLNSEERAAKLSEGVTRLGMTVAILVGIVMVILKAARKGPKPRRVRRRRGEDRDTSERSRGRGRSDDGGRQESDE